MKIFFHFLVLALPVLGAPAGKPVPSTKDDGELPLFPGGVKGVPFQDGIVAPGGVYIRANPGVTNSNRYKDGKGNPILTPEGSIHRFDCYAVGESFQGEDVWLRAFDPFNPSQKMGYMNAKYIQAPAKAVGTEVIRGVFFLEAFQDSFHQPYPIPTYKQMSDLFATKGFRPLAIRMVGVFVKECPQTGYELQRPTPPEYLSNKPAPPPPEAIQV